MADQLRKICENRKVKKLTVGKNVYFNAIIDMMHADSKYAYIWIKLNPKLAPFMVAANIDEVKVED